MGGGRGRVKRNNVKNKGGAQMVIVSTIKEISYFVVSLFDDLVGPFIFICDIKFFGRAVCFSSATA